ncbi:MAG: DUF1232 domain-containing protein [Bacteroidetes bacterium]|jgi:uncharacterized membrane protein YkvA (DUF1232 family)|nr:DUF1232 domain-containing protein [Bacteroidota bacterium]
MSNKDQPKGFDKAKRKAEELLNNGTKLKTVLDKGIKKAKDENNALSGFFDDLQKLFRMLKAYITGHYKDFSVSTLVYVVAGIVYFVNPFDVLPDFIVGLGFIDDATVIAFVIKKIQTELTSFTLWEANNTIEK